MNRAYALLEIRSADDDKRILEGIANTGEIDSYNSILEPEGAEFRLPLPVLYQHNSRQPIGHVIDAKVTKTGIRVKIQIAKAGIAGFIDEAWALIRNGLVGGLSVGFDPIEEVFDKSFGGYRYPKWKWHELSTVTIPANTGATISSVRSADEAVLAALGTRERPSVVRLNLNTPGVSGLTQGKPMNETLRDQIINAEGKIAAAEARQNDIVKKCTDEGRTRNAEEIEACESDAREVSDLTAHIDFLKKRESSMVARAAAVPSVTPAANSNPQQDGERARRSEPINVRSNSAKGVGVARMAIALHHAQGNMRTAAELARENWPDNPEVEKALQYQAAMKQRAGVDAGDTTTSGWASQLVPAAQQLQNEFLEMLRPATILGKIPGLRRVPFNVAVPIQTGAGTYNWVGEAAGKPVTSLTFSSVTLRWAKAAGIIVITEELAKFSSPSAEMIIRDDMLAGCARFLDTQFVGTAAEVSNVSPAGILNGISSTAATGTTSTHFRTDMNNMLNNFIANNVDPSGIVLLISATQALALSLMVTDLNVRLFPDIGIGGGTLLGFPVVISENVGTKIIALNARDILMAEDGGIRIDVSREASVEMETTPAVGEQSPLSTLTNLKSLWQNNLVGFRVERYITWKAGRTSAVEYITGNAYVPQ